VDYNYPDTLVTEAGFARLTCNYGDPLSLDSVTMVIDCFRDAGTAEKWYRYYRKETPYPFTESQYAPANPRATYEHGTSHRVSGVGSLDPARKRVYTANYAYADWDFAVNGRYEAEITSTSPYEKAGEQNKASARNVERIKQFTACYGTLKPGAAPAPAQKVVRGTITGSQLTRELYTDLNAAMEEAYSGRGADKAVTLEERLGAGSIAKNPLRHAKVVWKGSQEAGARDPEYTTTTDGDGKFEIPAALSPGKQYAFDVEFTYRKGSTDYFSVSDASGDVATYTHLFTWTGDRDLQQDVDVLAEVKKADVDTATLDGYSSTLMLYDETANAFEFYTEHLGETLDCNIPLHVYPFREERRTVFRIDDGTGKGTPAPAIVITPADSSFDNPLHSQYVVYHEFSHYAMYCLYGKKFPGSAADTAGPVKAVNHGGYMNPSTSDSFVEGFADFMPAIIAEYYGNPLAGKESGMGSIEDEFKAWDFAGKGEEYAVSTTLWSLYDTDTHYRAERQDRERYLRADLGDPETVARGAAERGLTEAAYGEELSRQIALLQSGQNTFLSQNRVRLRFDELWPVLRTYQQDVAAVHDSLVARYPAKKAAIDEVFLSHGFYRDTGRGNGTYDDGEPFRPASGDRKTYAAGDPFTDFPSGGFHHTGTETVGPAGDYLRTTRSSMEPLPGHFIKTPVDVPLYVVSVEYEDQPWKSYKTVVSGTRAMVPVPVPPPAEKARVVVVPDGVKYASPLSFRSGDFNRNFSAAASRGYFLEHDFKVTGPIPSRTTVRAGGPAGILSRLLTADGPGFRAVKAAGSGDYRGLVLLLVPGAGALAAVLLIRRKDGLR
jgi:hypothetical protein